MRQRHKWIEYWDDERAEGNSLIVTLVRGRRFEENGEHVRGFDTATDAMRAVRASMRCQCHDCVD